MLVKTETLTRPALDYAVAMCEGFSEYDPDTEKMLPPRKEYGWVSLCEYDYSTDWSQGGPIIERERIDLLHVRQGDLSVVWEAAFGNDEVVTSGPTPLIAAMRCYCCAKLGDTVEVPDNLLEHLP